MKMLMIFAMNVSKYVDAVFSYITFAVGKP